MSFPLHYVAAIAAVFTIGADSPTITRNATGTTPDGAFFSFWHDGGTGRMTLRDGGRYAVEWTLGKTGNLVAGTGWATGSRDRVVRYRAARFDPGSNGYLTLYGWSTGPLVEYYVVDDWGGFTPPGPGATFLGTIDSDGGTYRQYRTRRIDQPSIAGTATFDQYWSVRTVRRPAGGDAVITFRNHVAAWERAGLPLGAMGYQLLATEGFGSTGRSDVTVSRR